MATLVEIKDALDEGLTGGVLRKKLHLHEDIDGPLFPIRESAPPMMGMEPLLPSREPHPQSFRNSPEHNPDPDNEALEVPTETFIRYLDRHEKSQMEQIIKSHIDALVSFEKWLTVEIASGRIKDREEYYENYHYGSPYEELDHEMTNFDSRLIKLGLLDYRKEWDTKNQLSPVPYVLNVWLEDIARQYHEGAYVGFGGYVEILGSPEDASVPLVIDESTQITEQVYGGDGKREEEEGEGISYDPFTRKEIAILNYLAQNFTKDELITLSQNTDPVGNRREELGKRWRNSMKLFGFLDSGPQALNMAKKAKESKYAKWAVDNWTEGKGRGYSKVTHPIKVLPKWYNVNYTEDISQVEFRSGKVDLIAFDEDDAVNKGDEEFFDWGGETEIDDYGDSEKFDHEIIGTQYRGLAEEIRKYIREQLLTEQDKNKDSSWSDDEKELGWEEGPFTPEESRILNILAKTFTKEELKYISEETIVYGHEALGVRWEDLMKLLGHSFTQTSSRAKRVVASMYAKWGYDNWDLMKESEGDYGKIKVAYKALPKNYQIEYDESVNQTEFRAGTTDIVAFDEDDALRRGEEEFWDWDGETETYDYGESETYDSSVTGAHYLGLAEAYPQYPSEEEVTKYIDDTYKDEFLALYKLYKIGKEHGPKLVGGVTDGHIKGFLRDIQSDLVSNNWIEMWTGNPDVWQYSGNKYIPWDRSPFGRVEYHQSIIRWAQSVLLEDILKKEKYVKNAYSFLDEKFPTVVPNEYYPFGGGQHEEAVRSISHIAGLSWHEAQIIVDNFWREKRKEGKVTASGKDISELTDELKKALTEGLLEEKEQKKVLKEAKIIKLDRLEEMYGDYKDTLFRYWDQKGPHNDPEQLKLVGIDTRKEQGLYKVIDRWLIEWYGGIDQAIIVVNEKLKGIHHVIDGGYNFKYVITSIDENEKRKSRWAYNEDEREYMRFTNEAIGIFVILDGSGTVGLTVAGGPQYTLWQVFHQHQRDYLGDALDKTMMDEIQMEMEDVLHDNLTDLIKETGVRIDYVTVKGATRPGHFPPAQYIHESADIFGQGLLEPIQLQPYETEEDWEEDVAKIDPLDDYEDYEEYEGSKTDPEMGFVAPSRDVLENICKVRGFCKAQGPITFGQLKALVEAATSKRIASDISRGVFKTLWRVIPFFLPQLLFAAVGITATRALNKIITPALKDTKGYKRWWGKVVLKAMDIAEGDYIPDVALGDDPLSKIFFVSDGLLQMIRDKYKLKFARYVADVAASKPDDEPVPDWFVENLLRDYLNQKFLLDPPLGPKYGVDIKKKLREQREQEISPQLQSGDIIRVIDTPTLWWENEEGDRREEWGGGWAFGTPTLFSLYWVWKPSVGTPVKEGEYIIIALEDIEEIFDKGTYEGDTLESVPGNLHRKLKVIHRANDDKWLKVELSDEERDRYNIDESIERTQLQEHKQPTEINPELNHGDIIRVIDINLSTNNLHTSVIPKLFELYWVSQRLKGSEKWWGGEYRMRRGGEVGEYQYEIFPLEWIMSGAKAVEAAPHLLTPELEDKWVKIEPSSELLQEHKQPTEINPILKEGDRVMVVNMEKDTQAHAGRMNLGRVPTLYTPYEVWRVSERELGWGVKYSVRKVGKERRGREGRGVYDIIPNIDTWIKIEPPSELLQEHQQSQDINPILKTGDIVRVIDIPRRKQRERQGRRVPELFELYWVWTTLGKGTGGYKIVPWEYGKELADNPEFTVIQHLSALSPANASKVRIINPGTGDKWIKVEKEALLEQKKPSREINPPLIRGDVIKIIENNDENSYLNLWTDYVVLTPLWHDERYKTVGENTWRVYTPADSGWDNRTVWGYSIINPDLIDEPGQEQEMDAQLFKWIKIDRHHPEVYYDFPLHENIERPELQEERQQNISPPLEIGDEIIVLHVDGQHNSMPHTFVPYRVAGGGRVRVGSRGVEGSMYYHIQPIDPDIHDSLASRPLGLQLVGIRTRILYELQDEWMFRPGFKREEEEILKEESEEKGEISRPILKVGDKIKVIDRGDTGEGELELFVNYVVKDIIYQNEAAGGRYRIIGEPWKGETKGPIMGYEVYLEGRDKWMRPVGGYVMRMDLHQWIIVDDKPDEEEVLNEDTEGDQRISKPTLKVGDVIKIIDNAASGEAPPYWTNRNEQIVDEDGYVLNDGELLELFVNYVVEDIIYNNTAPTGRKRIKGDQWKGEIKGDIWGYGISNEEEYVNKEYDRDIEELKTSGPYQWIVVDDEPKEEISEDDELKHGKSLTADQGQLVRGFDKWKNLKEHEEKVNPPIVVGDTITVIAYEDPDIEYMTDEELKDFMESKEVQDVLLGDWNDFEESADLMGFRHRIGKGWYHKDSLSGPTLLPELFIPYKIIDIEDITNHPRWIGHKSDEIRYLLLSMDEKGGDWIGTEDRGSGRIERIRREIRRWLYPSQVKYIISPTKKSLQEEKDKKIEINPPLKPGDKIKVVDVDEDSDQRRQFMNGMDILTSERFPELYHTYTVIDENEEMKSPDLGGSPRWGWTRGYEGSGLDIDEGIQLLWLLMDKEEEGVGEWRKKWRVEGGRRVDYKVIAPHFDKWIKVEDELHGVHPPDADNDNGIIDDTGEALNESVINKNDDEVIGKEFWFEYHCNESHSSCDAELWYHSHQKVIVLERGIDDHDEYPDEHKIYKVRFEDGWEYVVFDDELMDSPEEFYRPTPPPKEELLQEHREINPQLQEGDWIVVIDIAKQRMTDRVEGEDGWYRDVGGEREGRKPKVFVPYQVQWSMRDAERLGLDDNIIEYSLLENPDDEFSVADSLAMGRQIIDYGIKVIYPTIDKWMKIESPESYKAPQTTLEEQEFPFNPKNKEQERDHPEGEPSWSIRRGKQHYALNVDPTPQEPVTAFNKYLVKNSPFNFLGFDYYLSAVPANMSDEARIDVYVPILDDSAVADGIWGNTFKFYHKKNEEAEWTEDYEEFIHDKELKYSMEEIPMSDVGYHATWPNYYGYEEFEDLHPEAAQEYKDRESDHLNPDGKVYETSWRKRFNMLRDEMIELAKLFGLEKSYINRDPGHPWKRQTDSYGSQDIRPGTKVPYGWPRQSDKEQ